MVDFGGNSVILPSSFLCPALCPRSLFPWAASARLPWPGTSSWGWPIRGSGADMESSRLDQQQHLLLLRSPCITVALHFNASLCLQLLSGSPSSLLQLSPGSAHMSFFFFLPLPLQIKEGNTSLLDLGCSFPLACLVPLVNSARSTPSLSP